jgi:acyl-coenzyme A thioesterase PaaI-like protein
MGAAAQTMAGEGHWVLTAEFKVSLLRAGRGQRLECIGIVIKPGRQVMFTEAEVFAIDGDTSTLVAKASATMAVVKA